MDEGPGAEVFSLVDREVVMRASRLAAFFLVTFVAALANEVFAQPATPPAVHVEPDPNADTFSDSVGATPGQFRVDELRLEAGPRTYKCFSELQLRFLFRVYGM